MSIVSFRLRFKILILNLEGGSNVFYQKYSTEWICIMHVYMHMSYYQGIFWSSYTIWRIYISHIHILFHTHKVQPKTFLFSVGKLFVKCFKRQWGNGSIPQSGWGSPVTSAVENYVENGKQKRPRLEEQVEE